MKVCMAGQGAFGQKHLEAMRRSRASRSSRSAAAVRHPTTEVARKFTIPHWTTDLAESLAPRASRRPYSRRRRRCTPGRPTMSARRQARANRNSHGRFAGRLGTHRGLQQETGLVAMAGHTRRFNPSHQWIHKRIEAGEIRLQQMDVQTYFFRRTNMNALGQPRSWTDHLLWHHACHTVDLFNTRRARSRHRSMRSRGRCTRRWASRWT